jgi:hypothetical protein
MTKIFEETLDAKKSKCDLKISVRKILVFGVKSLEELEKVVKMLSKHTYSGHKKRGMCVAKRGAAETEEEQESEDDDCAADNEDGQENLNTTRPKYFAQDLLIGEFSFCLYVEQ